MFNDTAVKFRFLASIFHQDNSKFDIKVDNDFVKSQDTKEQLLGISENVWVFTTCKYSMTINNNNIIIQIHYFYITKLIFHYFTIIFLLASRSPEKSAGNNQ